MQTHVLQKDTPPYSVSPRRGLWLLALVYLPFVVNDFALQSAIDTTDWLLIDYAFRIVVLLLILFVPELRLLARSGDIPRFSVSRVCLATFLISAVIIAIDVAIDRFLPVESIPRIGEPLGDYWQSPLLLFDITAGLFIVAISEELVARRIAARVLWPLLGSKWMVIVVSALLFGLVHWGWGWRAVITSTLAGLLLMSLYLFAGRLWPVVVAHYVVNLLLFTGLLTAFTEAVFP